MRMNRLRRPAVTLIELLVVISIVLLISGLAYLAMPNLQSRRMVDAADRLTGWLLISKMQAKRDGRPTGVRFVQDSAGNFTILQYIQAPDDFFIAGSTCQALSTSPTTVQFAGLTDGTGGTPY